MKKLLEKSEIWTIKPEDEDFKVAAHYASISLPWTFNRMMMNLSSAGQQRRALNIAKGILAQEGLKRLFIKHGIEAKTQRKSHRDSDLFDFKIKTDQGLVKLDVKTINHYNNYENVERPTFSVDYLMENSSYSGPQWSQFFPMLIPHTQVRQEKDCYCFAIASSHDFRKDVAVDRNDYMLAAFPFKEHAPFMHSQQLCLAREEEGKGIFLNVTFDGETLFDNGQITLNVIGEWDGGIQKLPVTIKNGIMASEIGPFSCVNCFQISKPDFDKLGINKLKISISSNKLRKPVRNSTRRNLNVSPKGQMVLTSDDFCNLILPTSYELNFLGWLLKDEFLATFKKYPGYIWPDDKTDSSKNQEWSQITENDLKTITKLDIEDCISKEPTRLNAGLLKGMALGGSACCYVYPNIFGGGLRETNLYVLPSDLCVMDLISS